MSVEFRCVGELVAESQYWADRVTRGRQVMECSECGALFLENAANLDKHASKHPATSEGATNVR